MESEIEEMLCCSTEIGHMGARRGEAGAKTCQLVKLKATADTNSSNCQIELKNTKK